MMAHNFSIDVQNVASLQSKGKISYTSTQTFCITKRRFYMLRYKSVFYAIKTIKKN